MGIVKSVAKFALNFVPFGNFGKALIDGETTIKTLVFHMTPLDWLLAGALGLIIYEHHTKVLTQHQVTREHAARLIAEGNLQKVQIAQPVSYTHLTLPTNREV